VGQRVRMSPERAGMLLAMYEADPWQEKHPNVMVVLAGEPAPGTDWRDQEGWGWIFKAWFRTRAESRQAWEAIKAEGWEIEPKSWGRKVRVGSMTGTKVKGSPTSSLRAGQM
jgi:hypothetical protein